MKDTGFTLKDIGRFLGRDHSTCSYLYDVGLDDTHYNKQFADAYNRVRDEFLGELKLHIDIPDAAIRSAINVQNHKITQLEEKIKSLTLQLENLLESRDIINGQDKRVAGQVLEAH